LAVTATDAISGSVSLDCDQAVEEKNKRHTAAAPVHFMMLFNVFMALLFCFKKIV
jgi:hypothetical protein